MFATSKQRIYVSDFELEFAGSVVLNLQEAWNEMWKYLHNYLYTIIWSSIYALEDL